MVVSMSEKEFSRLSVLMDAQAGRLRIDDAAQLLELKRRQVFRLLKGLRKDGAASLASKRRGRTSNNKLRRAARTRKVRGAARSVISTLQRKRHF